MKKMYVFVLIGLLVILNVYALNSSLDENTSFAISNIHNIDSNSIEVSYKILHLDFEDNLIIDDEHILLENSFLNNIELIEAEVLKNAQREYANDYRKKIFSNDLLLENVKTSLINDSLVNDIENVKINLINDALINDSLINDSMISDIEKNNKKSLFDKIVGWIKKTFK